MNRILLETHKRQNIDLLRVRDIFFDKCRKLNTVKNVCQIIPILVLFVSYFPYISSIEVINEYRDYYSGAMAIMSYVVILFISNRMEKYLQISNAFREEYDVRVFEIKRNEYLYDPHLIDKYSNVANQAIGDSPKYEYWYEEIFSANHPNNVICCQMDNIIYTYHVYRRTRTVYICVLAGVLVGVLSVWMYLRDISFVILSFLALFSIIQTFLEYIDTSKNLVEKNEFITNSVLHNGKVQYTLEDARCIQDCIFSNREMSLFIPKFIRNKYLADGNPYYKDLDSIKEKLLDEESISIPSSADEIEILSSDGLRCTKLSVLQKRLVVMLHDIKNVLEKNDICYTLDGGTLIGAKREGGKFIFWDDDIDLAIRYEEFERAKNALVQELSDKYEFQDYYNEMFYSPRLSSLRMREKNELSIVDERDSALYELYTKRGLFIDIYVYSPILYNLMFDRLYRHFRIHMIHKKIKRIEELWKADKKKYEQQFIKTKCTYMKRVEWYLSHAKNNKYYAYTPNYCENLKKAGPYIKRENLYGEKTMCEFEGAAYRVPTNTVEVLKSFYGEGWSRTPFVPLTEYKNYSEKKFAVTKLKHILYFNDGESNVSVDKNIHKALQSQ